MTFDPERDRNLRIFGLIESGFSPCGKPYESPENALTHVNDGKCTKPECHGIRIVRTKVNRDDVRYSLLSPEDYAKLNKKKPMDKEEGFTWPTEI